MSENSAANPLSGQTEPAPLTGPVLQAVLNALGAHRDWLALAATGAALTAFVVTIAFSGASLLNAPDEGQIAAKSGDTTVAFLQGAPDDDATSPSILATRDPDRASIAANTPEIQTSRKTALGAPQPSYRTENLKVGRNDVLMNMLVDAGTNRQQAYYAIEELKKIYNPRKLRVGQQVTVTFETPVAPTPDATSSDATSPDATSQDIAAPEPRLFGLEIKTEVDQRVAVARSEDGSFVSQKIITKLQTNYTRAGGTIDSSLYLAALDAGIPDAVIVELIAMFSYDIDFQRETRKGDDFEVYFTRLYDPQGKAVKTGNIEYAAMTVRGKQKGYYRFQTPDDKITDYYDAKGQSAKKFLMRTPVNGARISSGFGRRKHPVLGYQKAHKGTDFAAPTGTPVMAAGNGTIERSSRYGSYGNYVRIRHANGYKTAYAHLSRYGKGIKSGRRVKQGQTIGYVGATGRVTGAHLHYEVIKDGNKVNPLKIKVPTGRKLNGNILKAFKEQHLRLDTEIAALPDWRTIQTVEAEGDEPETSKN